MFEVSSVRKTRISGNCAFGGILIRTEFSTLESFGH